MIHFFLVFSDAALLVLRVVLGLTLAKSGWGKTKDLQKTAKGFSKMGFKPGNFWGTLVALLELVGGSALMFGLLTQVFAFLFAIQFIVILLTVKRSGGFVEARIEWLILAAALILLTTTGGAYSLDNYFGLWIY